MRKSLLALVFCFAFALNGCVTKQHSSTATSGIKPGENLVAFSTPKHRPKMNNNISVLSQKDALKRPYRVIGKEYVSRYNFIGLERQNKAIDDIMKNLAASMGGDAIINITADNQKVEGTVISYERMVL